MKLCPQCGRTLLDTFQICPDDGVKLAVPGQILRGAPVAVTASSSLRKSASQDHAPPWVKFATAGGAGLICILAVAIFVIQAGSQKAPKALTVDQLIQSGETNKAVAILQKVKNSHLQTKSDSEKLDGLLIDSAATASVQNRVPDAVALLERVDTKSPRRKEVQHLLDGLRSRGHIGFAPKH